jgi:hypothetical protein
MTHPLIVYARRDKHTNKHHARQVLDVCCETLDACVPRAILVQSMASTLSIKRATVIKARALLVQLGYLVHHGTDSKGSWLCTLGTPADVSTAWTHRPVRALGADRSAP